MNKRETTKRDNRSKLALLLLLIAFIIIVGFSLAFFSDIITGGITGTVGTLDIRSNPNPVTATQHWTNTAGSQSTTGLTTIANWNPGDVVEVGYTVTNAGNKSAWLRNQVALTITGTNHAGQALGAGAGQVNATGVFELFVLTGTQTEAQLFALMRDPSRVPGTGALAVSDATGGITWATPDADRIIMNGTGANAETETTGVNSANTRFFLFYNPRVATTGAIANSFQGLSGITFNVSTQAMQYRNNPTPNWSNVVTNEFTLGTP